MKKKTDNMQTTLFETEKPLQNNCGNTMLTADARREQAKAEWLKNYPFKYNLFRVLKEKEHNKITHINSLYNGYNDEGYPAPGYEGRMGKYIEAHTLEEIKRVIYEAKGAKKYYYIYTRLYDELIDNGIYDYSECGGSICR